MSAEETTPMGPGLVPSRPIIKRRPNINDLYAKLLDESPDVAKMNESLATVQGKPIDYSGVQRVGAHQQQAAHDDTIGGMIMSTMLGQNAAPVGHAVLRQALENSKPLRANLADVGYTDPATGEFVENPMVARSREEKMQASRIDSVVRAQEHKVNALLAVGKIAEAQQAHDELNTWRTGMLGIAQQRADQAGANAGARATARATAAAAKGAPQLTVKQQNEMADINSQHAAIDAAIAAVDKAPTAFSISRGIPGSVAGEFGESLVGRTDTPLEGAARYQVYNQVSSIIKARAGTAQTKQEMEKIMRFLPTAYDNAAQIKQKLAGYREFLHSQEAGQGTPVPKSGATPHTDATPGGRIKFNDLK